MLGNERWSPHGAPWLQPVAISGKSVRRRSGGHKPRPWSCVEVSVLLGVTSNAWVIAALVIVIGFGLGQATALAIRLTGTRLGQVADPAGAIAEPAVIVGPG